MPDVEGPAKRTLSRANGFEPNPRAPFVELGLASAFSFLRAASDACDLAATANRLGYDAVGIADRNTLAGVVRMHVEVGTAKVRPVIGARLALACGAELLAYPADRAAYARLSTLLSRGKTEDEGGGWQAKGETHLTLEMLAEHGEGLHLIAMPGADLDRFEAGLPRLARALPAMGHVGASHLYRGDDRARIARLDALARRHGLSILATGDVLYHAPQRRPLQDVMTCIREGTTLARAGLLLEPNAERHLKSPAEMARLFADWPHAIRAAREVADACRFSLGDLAYEYPHEIVPEGRSPEEELERLTWEGAARRYPGGIPPEVRATLAREFALIRSKRIARYFLTIHDIVRFAREEASPPILCQGRGSAANSAVCFCLGVTSVDPLEHQLLFERFLSEERSEPPDIDVDFEHERREEVIRYIYAKYGRERAGLCATVIHYRPRSAIREVGRAMGLSEDVTSKLAGTVWGSWGSELPVERVRGAGLDASDPHLRLVLRLANQMIGMPRHLSQHVGGFVLTERPLTEIVPIGHGAMPERSFIEWDKDDLDALGIFKVDVLALGMLTCIAKGLALIEAHHGASYDLATIPSEDREPDEPGRRPTYDMLCAGDSLGVFQVESRAQMAMLPKLRPREFYDLVIEVAIVRPGPIQGDMVHPYLRRRQKLEAVKYPAPGPEHPPDELERILSRTLGVPIFQEQAMKIAIDAAGFSSAEANELRRAMATFRSRGTIEDLQERMVGRMSARGYDPVFAQRCFDQIKGFGEYGFPESHAASFAKLVYVSSWMKCHHPAAFACALLNSQPMGFYAPAQIVRDAREHGVEVRPADVNLSDWDCTLEPAGAPGEGAAPDGEGAAGREATPSIRRRAWAHVGERIGGGASVAVGAAGHGMADAPGHEPERGRAGEARGGGGWMVVGGGGAGEAHGGVACPGGEGRDPDAPGGRSAASGADAAVAPGRGGPEAPTPIRFALRLGLRQIDGMRQEAAARIMAARDAPYADLADLRARGGLDAGTLRRLAAADALRSMGLDRRGGLWQARALVDAPALPIFEHARARAEGPDPAVTLPAMPRAEQVVADYQTLRLSLRAHPMAFFRASLRAQGFRATPDLPALRHGAFVSVAGLVAGAPEARQREGGVLHHPGGRGRGGQPRDLAQALRALPPRHHGRAPPRGARTRADRRARDPRRGRPARGPQRSPGRTVGGPHARDHHPRRPPDPSHPRPGLRARPSARRARDPTLARLPLTSRPVVRPRAPGPRRTRCPRRRRAEGRRPDERERGRIPGFRPECRRRAHPSPPRRGRHGVHGAHRQPRHGGQATGAVTWTRPSRPDAGGSRAAGLTRRSIAPMRPSPMRPPPPRGRGEAGGPGDRPPGPRVMLIEAPRRARGGAGAAPVLTCRRAASICGATSARQRASGAAPGRRIS